MRGECKPGQPAAEVALPEPSEVIIARAAKLKPLDMSQSALRAGLVDWELAVLDKMYQAASAMDAVYWQQVDPDDVPLFRSLDGDTDPTEAAERLMLDANYGRWDRFDEFVPFLGDEPRPAGGYVYPTDLTKEELDAYIAAHPEEKDGLLSPYTVVQRGGDRRVAVPYQLRRMQVSPLPLRADLRFDRKAHFCYPVWALRDSPYSFFCSSRSAPSMQSMTSK